MLVQAQALSNRIYYHHYHTTRRTNVYPPPGQTAASSDARFAAQLRKPPTPRLSWRFKAQTSDNPQENNCKKVYTRHGEGMLEGMKMVQVCV